MLIEKKFKKKKSSSSNKLKLKLKSSSYKHKNSNSIKKSHKKFIKLFDLISYILNFLSTNKQYKTKYSHLNPTISLYSVSVHLIYWFKYHGSLPLLHQVESKL